MRFPSSNKFLKTINNKQVKLFSLYNKNGLKAGITNYGGRVVSLLVPDMNDNFDDIVTGYNSIEDYLDVNESYFGAIVGRYANRIAKGKFSIDNEDYSLEINNPPNHLHGGKGGFSYVVWDAEQINSSTLRLSYLSPHMENGYPGNLNVEVVYRLTDDNEFQIIYEATTDKKTIVNLTNHAYFNLAGEGNKVINNHLLKINAEHYTPVDETLIPTGKIASLENTPFDFREYTPVGKNIDADHPQIKYSQGYDHNFVLNRFSEHTELEFAASVYDPESKRKMEVFTTEPGMQFYTANFLSGKGIGKKGEAYERRTSFCLETQHFPDSPNKPEFPSTLLKDGEKYQSKTTYRFSVNTD